MVEVLLAVGDLPCVASLNGSANSVGIHLRQRLRNTVSMSCGSEMFNRWKSDDVGT